MKDLDLKVARGIAAGTAVLAGLGVLGMMIFAGKAMEMGLNDYNLLGSLFIFFMATLYTLAVDAEISRRNTESEAMQKVHLTTLKQCIWMMVALLLLSIPCLFL